MPFKGIHGHTRHTHEDKVEAKKPRDKHPKDPQKQDQPAVKKEVDLYNTPFEPYTTQKPAYYINRFFRRSAQTVVHCVLALSPHFYIHTDELFDWMMPYERMGALLSEDAEDYIARKKYKECMKQQQLMTGNDLTHMSSVDPESQVNPSNPNEAIQLQSHPSSTYHPPSSNFSSCPSEAPNTTNLETNSQMYNETNYQIQMNNETIKFQNQPSAPCFATSSSFSSSEFSTIQVNDQPPSSYSLSSSLPQYYIPTTPPPLSYSSSSLEVPCGSSNYSTQTTNGATQLSDQSSTSYPSSLPSTSSASSATSEVSSIFSNTATNPETDHDIQVNPKNPGQAVQPHVSHFHPPFLIIDSRRDDEYKESHIHGAVNIHYVPPLPGKKLEFTLPSWVEKDTPIITYCAVGLRSGLMVWELRRRGYRFVKVLSGGYYKWVNEGRPIYANTGELTEKVLQQHKLAGIMLRKELKAQQKRQQRKEEMDARVASHHKNDSDWPPCHTYKPCTDQKRKSVLTIGNPDAAERRKSHYAQNHSETSGSSQM